MDEWLWPGLGVVQGGKAALTLFQRAIRHSDGRPWFTAARYVAAGTLGVASLRDWNDATHLAGYMGAPGTEAPVPTSNPAVFNGAPTIAFTNHMYQSNRPAADWDFASNGVSCMKWDVFVCNDAVGTGIVSITRAVGNGVQTYFSGGGVYFYMQSSGPVVVGPTFLGGVAAGGQVVTACRTELAAANQYELRYNGVLTAFGPYANPPDTPPEYPLSIGARYPFALPAVMDWAGTFFTPALGVDAVADINAWIAAGMPTP